MALLPRRLAERPHRAAAAAPAPPPDRAPSPRPGPARASGGLIDATVSSARLYPAHEHIGPERGGAGKQEDARAPRHRRRLRQYARHAERHEPEPDGDADRDIERNTDEGDHGTPLPLRLERRMAREPGELGLAGVLAAHELGELFRRVVGRDGHAERLHAPAERGRIDRLVEALVEQGDDRRRGLAGRGEADEAAVVEA